jgi:glycosyltransferase involved in cell wall biosynthesis
MRIAVWHNLPSGGGKRALYNHIKALKERGHYIESWTTDLASADYLPLSEIITEHCMPLKAKLQKVEKSKNPLIQTIKRNKLFKSFFTECVNEIQKGGFDLIFANACRITYMPYIGLYAKIPVVVYLGEPNRYLFEASEKAWALPNFKLSLRGLNKMRKDFFKTYSQRIQLREEINAAKSCTKILVNSLYSRESIIRAYGIDATVCYLGIDTKSFHSDTIEKKPYVVGLSSLFRFKGIHKAIEVISKIPSDIRPGLIWIGNSTDNSYLDFLKELANNLNVDFTTNHEITDSELIKIVSSAAVMIYTPWLEPFGLAPLEANACGTHVVAIAEGGIRESITNGKNGTLINGYKLDEFAKEITTFTTNTEYALKKGLEARDFVLENWNEKTMAKNIVLEIECVIDKNE